MLDIIINGIIVILREVAVPPVALKLLNNPGKQRAGPLLPRKQIHPVRIPRQVNQLLWLLVLQSTKRTTQIKTKTTWRQPAHHQPQKNNQQPGRSVLHDLLQDLYTLGVSATNTRRLNQRENSSEKEVSGKGIVVHPRQLHPRTQPPAKRRYTTLSTQVRSHSHYSRRVRQNIRPYHHRHHF